MAYFVAKYEWPWLRNTELGFPKCHVPMRQSFYVLFITEQSQNNILVNTLVSTLDRQVTAN